MTYPWAEVQKEVQSGLARLPSRKKNETLRQVSTKKENVWKSRAESPKKQKKSVMFEQFKTIYNLIKALIPKIQTFKQSIFPLISSILISNGSCLWTPFWNYCHFNSSHLWTPNLLNNQVHHALVHLLRLHVHYLHVHLVDLGSDIQENLICQRNLGQGLRTLCWLHVVEDILVALLRWLTHHAEPILPQTRLVFIASHSLLGPSDPMPNYGPWVDPPHSCIAFLPVSTRALYQRDLDAQPNSILVRSFNAQDIITHCVLTYMGSHQVDFRAYAHMRPVKIQLA